jgi:curved DNA-binding protein CbpA
MSEAYALLGLRPTATSDEVKKAYRRLAKEHHPDVAGADCDPEIFKGITSAYSQALLDSVRRGGNDGTSTGASSSYGPGRQRREAWQEHSRPPPRPRTSYDNFNHKAWDEAHYGSEREARQSEYVRGLHRHARGAGGFTYDTSTSSRGRRGGDSGSGSASGPASFLSVLLSAGALWTVYHLLYSSHFGWLREENKRIEAKHHASTKQTGRRR